MSWEELELGEVSTTLKGFAFKSEWFSSSEIGIPVVKVKDFTLDSISIEKVEYLPINIANDFQKYSLKFGDVIIQTVGSWASNPNSVVGKVVKVPESLENGLLNQNAVKLIFNDKVDKTFIFYNLKTYDFKGYIINTAQGAANQASITLESIKSYKINLPPLQTQKRIASILSAYDDLIENNLKRIKLLEETAQNIYKEWFVHFRFPNFENTPFNEETGLPEGWEVKMVGDCIHFLKGKKPKNEFSTDGENRVLYLLVDVLERRELRYTENDSIQLAKQGETLMLMDGSRSGMVFKSLDGAIGSTLAVFRIKNGDFGLNYCFNFFKFRENEIISKNTGSAIPHANKSYISAMDIVVPSNDLKLQFETITRTLYNQIETLFSQNQKLKEARDILLPRLMDRTIEV